ncbi:PAS domain S-box protein [Rhodoflexus sp.]
MIIPDTGKSRALLQEEAEKLRAQLKILEEKLHHQVGEPARSSASWICLHDLSGNIIRMSDEMRKLFEPFSKEGKPENLRHFIVYDQRHLFKSYIEQLIEQTRTEGEQQLIDKNGNLHYVRFEARLEQVTGITESSSYVRWSAWDISGEQPETSQQDYCRQLFQNSPQAMVLLNAGGIVVEINETAARFLQKQSAKGLTGIPFQDFIHSVPAHKKRLREQIIEAWKNQQATYHWTAKSPLGDLRENEVLFRKVRYGRQDMLIGFLSDVTHQQANEESVIASYNELKVVKETIRAIAGMHRTDDILIAAIAKLYELDYIKGAGFYQVSNDLYFALLKFHFNIDNRLLPILKEIQTAQYPTVFQERQSLELPAGTLSREQQTHLMFIPIIIENKVGHVLLVELESYIRNSALLLNLLSTEIGSFITQARLANKLVQSENRFRIIADNSPSLLRTTDANGNFVFFSQRWYRFVGLQGEGQIQWLQYVHPEDRNHVMSVFNSNLIKRQNFEISYRLRKQNGDYRWMLENGVPYFDNQNDFEGFIFSASDITERKAKELEITRAEALRYSREGLESAIEKAQILALTVETDGCISYCNRFLLQSTGWDEEALIGIPLQQILIFDNTDKLIGNSKFFHEQLLNTFRGKLRCANGEYLQLRFNTIVWNNTSGEPASVTIVGEDISETMRVQQALTQSNLLLQDLFDNASDLIQITNETGQFAFVNKAWYNTMEYTPEDLRTIRLQDVVHEDSSLTMRQMLEKAAIEGAVGNFETCFVSRSGRKISLRGSISYSFEEGKSAMYRAVFHDVTEQIRSEKAQTLYYNLSRLTVNSTNLEMLYHNFYMELKKTIEVDSFLIALRNEKDQSVYFPYFVNSDYAPDEGIQGRAFAEYALTFDRPMFFYDDMMRRIIQSNDIHAEDPLPQTWMGVPLKIDQKVIGMIILQSYRDRKMYNKRDLDLLNFISGQLATAIQRTQNQEKINEQNARLQAIFESGQHLMWSVNKDLVITRFNGNYANSLRLLYNLNLTSGMSLPDIYRQNDREQAYFWLDKYKLAFSGYPQQFERKMIGINGEEYWYEVFLSPIITTNGFEVDEVAGVAHNITVKKKAADELRLAKELAEHSLEVKKRFLSNMSHEIRTPMNGIIGMIDLLSEAENLEPEYQQYITTIKKSSETLLHILNDILDLSKIEAGKMELRKTPISTLKMMDKLIALFQQRALQKDIAFGYRVAEDVPRYIIADETRLLQILSNLTSNALKFTEKGSIEILLEVEQMPDPNDILLDEHQQGYLLRAKVIDTGIGIAPEQQNLLFQKFSQLDNSYTKSYSGTGLGLSISQELCRLMHGDIGVASEPGKGSTFWFTFRAKECAADDVVMEESEHLRDTQISGQILSNPYILVVDDNSVNLNVARSILKRAGCHVSIARSGKEAIEIVQQQAFDLIFMDVQMPVMNGIETTQHIKQLGIPNLPPIVAMTAFSMQEERESFLQAGMDDFIAKPIKAQALIAKVKEMIAGKDIHNPPPADAAEDLLTLKHPPSNHSPNVISPEVIAQMTKYGGREMVEESFVEFEQESRQLIEALAMHVSEQQFDQAKSILHTLKGNAGTLGIEKLYAAAASFEAALKQGQTSRAEEEFAEIIRLFTEFQQHYRSILQINS